MSTRVRVLVLSGGNFVSLRLFEALQSLPWAAPSYIEAGTPNLAHMLEQSDAVVNCTGSPGSSMVAVAEAIAAAARTRSIKVVQLSSISVYGRVEGTIDESNPLVKGVDEYSDGKAKSDEIVSRIPGAVVLREGIVYGPGSDYWGGLIGRLLLSGRLGDLGPNGDGVCNLVYIDDVVQIVTMALQSKNTEGEIFNLVAPNPPTWNAFLIGYAKALGCKSVANISVGQLRVETKILAIILIIALKIAAKIKLTSLRLGDPIRTSLIDNCRQKITVDSSRLSAAYRVNWMVLDDGIREMAVWFQGQATHQ